MSTNLACPLGDPYVPSQMQINMRSMSVDLVNVFRTVKIMWTQVQLLQAQVDALTAAAVVQPTGTASEQVAAVLAAPTTPAGPNKRGRE